MGLIAWIRRRFARAPKTRRDPLLAAFDQRITELDGRASELRRSAATLLATRGELERGQAAAEMRARQCRVRADEAQKAAEAQARAVSLADAEAADTEARGFAEQMAKVDEDAQAIAETTRKLEGELASLKQERAATEARLTAAAAVAGASRALAEKADQLTALDEARDGVEQAKALADVYREDLARKR